MFDQFSLLGRKTMNDKICRPNQPNTGQNVSNVKIQVTGGRRLYARILFSGCDVHIYIKTKHKQITFINLQAHLVYNKFENNLNCSSVCVCLNTVTPRILVCKE